MATDDLKRTLDDALTTLQSMHHATVAALQKANEAEANEYVKFFEAQLELIAQASKQIESAANTKNIPFV